MPYVPPSGVHDPAVDVTIPSGWGDAVNTALDYLPRGTLAYGERTSNIGPDPFSPNPIKIDTVQLQKSVTLASQRRLRVTAWVSSHYSNVAGDTFIFGITSEVATAWYTFGTVRTVVASAGNPGAHVELNRLFAAGTYTFAVTIQRSGGSGSGTFEAAGNRPCFLHIEDLGAAT